MNIRETPYEYLRRTVERLPLNDGDTYTVVYHARSLVIVQHLMDEIGLTAMIDGILYTTTIELPVSHEETPDLVDLVNRFMAMCC